MRDFGFRGGTGKYSIAVNPKVKTAIMRKRCNRQCFADCGLRIADCGPVCPITPHSVCRVGFGGAKLGIAVLRLRRCFVRNLEASR
jgi:hypothetical protein